MSASIIVPGKTKEEKYLSLLPQIKALVQGDKDLIAGVSTIMAALKFGMDFFWVGVYFVKPTSGTASVDKAEQELVIGPFQGPVACTRIPFGNGVCGTAWKERRTVLVDDVEKFPGHIACSSASRSEIVVPCFRNAEVFAVLDVDSEKLANFDAMDKKFLEEIGKIISQLAD